MHAREASMDRPRPVARTRLRSRGLSNGRVGIPLTPFATLTAIAVPLAAASYGVETNNRTIAMIGLVVTAVVAAAVAFRANRSTRVRDALLEANGNLRRRNTDLEAMHQAVLQGLDVIDERTQGRLWELFEETGDELAELIDEALDDRGRDAE
jgi:acid phosphatase family membrane protein YuiD